MRVDSMREWYAGLSDRERGLVIGGGCIALALAATLLVRPLLSDNDALQAQISQRQSYLQWMQQAAADVEQLRKRAPQSDSSQSLQARVGTVARQARLNLERVQSNDADRVQVWLDDAPFDSLLQMISKLSELGAVIDKASIKAARAGRVDAQLTIANRG